MKRVRETDTNSLYLQVFDDSGFEIPDDNPFWFPVPEGKTLAKGEPDKNGNRPPVLENISIPIVAPEALAKEKLNAINDLADAILQPITSMYPGTEVVSWDKQEIEARRWQEWQNSDKADPEPSTALIDQILITRKDVDKPELVRRIIAKANTYATSGQIFGIRHTLEKQIESILADDTLTDDQKREAINAIDAKAAFSVVTL